MTTGTAVAPARTARGLRGPIVTRTRHAKLRVLLLTLLALTVLWGGIAAWTVAGYASAAGNVRTVSEPLSLDAQQIYRSLSDADATEAAAFLSGGQEPIALRSRYQADIAQTARELEAATAAAGASSAGSQLEVLSAGLPVYTGLVETARAENRLGYPLGAAYLREASGLMRSSLLPAARAVYAHENAQLAAADGQATAFPYAAVVVAVMAAIGLVAAQRWLARRTHRILNPGLVIASAAGLLSLIWLATAFTVASVQLSSARAHGSAPVEALAAADITALRAHADESLTLIDRGGDVCPPCDAFQQDFLAAQKQLGPGPGTLLTAATTASQGSSGAARAAAASRKAAGWYAVHRQVRSLDDAGKYTAGVRLALGPSPVQSGGLFRRLHADLTGAMAADQASFAAGALSAQDALTGLEAGMIVLCLVMAAGCWWGISQRLAEYR